MTPKIGSGNSLSWIQFTDRLRWSSLAATGSNAEAGLPGFGETRRPESHLVETVKGAAVIACPADVSEAIGWTTWQKRGWTFQELYCARRVLVVTDSLVYWCCQVVNWREDIVPASPDATDWRTSEESIWKRDQGACRMWFFCSQIHDFSSRSFGVMSDSLWAITGVLKNHGLGLSSGFNLGASL